MRKTLSLSSPKPKAASSSRPARPVSAPPQRRRSGPAAPYDEGRQPVPQAAPAERSLRPAIEPRKTDANGFVRLNKRMAELGLCSRREADEWIARGWVRVNGQPALMGQPVPPDAHIEIAAQAQHQQGQRVTILLHKPVGYVSGLPEDGHETAAVLVQARNQWQADPHRVKGPRWHDSHSRGLAPAGRLDIDSTGMLVLTQDGRVARTLIGDDSQIEKEYLVRVHWAPNGPQGAGVVAQDVRSAVPIGVVERLRHGLSIDGQPLKPAQVEWQNPEQLRFVLTEGKKRQIRRMCEQVGLHVVGLKRIRMGRVVLGNLPVGQWRYLRPDEAF
jgi:23S rRNA pseudouridine2604 synthase